jgi:hypothetical protein
LEFSELLHYRKHGHAITSLLVVSEEIYELILVVIIKLFELMILELDAVEAKATADFKE